MVRVPRCAGKKQRLRQKNGSTGTPPGKQHDHGQNTVCGVGALQLKRYLRTTCDFLTCGPIHPRGALRFQVRRKAESRPEPGVL